MCPNSTEFCFWFLFLPCRRCQANRAHFFSRVHINLKFKILGQNATFEFFYVQKTFRPSFQCFFITPSFFYIKLFSAKVYTKYVQMKDLPRECIKYRGVIVLNYGEFHQFHKTARIFSRKKT